MIHKRKHSRKNGKWETDCSPSVLEASIEHVGVAMLLGIWGEQVPILNAFTLSPC